MMKYLQYLILPALMFGPMAASAQVDLNEGLEEVGGTGYGVSGEPKGLEEIVGQIINVFLGILGVVFLILTIYAGILWMTAAGNDEKIGQAKKILTSSIIGLVIVLAAYSIASFVVTELSTATA